MTFDSRKVSTMCQIKLKFLLLVKKDLLGLDYTKMKYNYLFLKNLLPTLR